ncbi:MAG TPA: hypothetical protein VMW73_06230, partial [Spirochaetia bacterium]|nr:hypothetical protein [Spirochaetia bacterium]
MSGETIVTIDLLDGLNAKPSSAWAAQQLLAALSARGVTAGMRGNIPAGMGRKVDVVVGLAGGAVGEEFTRKHSPV